MKKNLEIKCKVRDFKKIKAILDNFRNLHYSVENQTDIYYKIKTGRLKLRIINNENGNLIFYDRCEQINKRISNYIISATDDFSELDAILRKQFKVLVTVHKKREIYNYKNIRIHLDKVKDLGRFLEVEIIFKNSGKANSQMKEIISKLNLNEKTFIKESYSDLLIKKS